MEVLQAELVGEPQRLQVFLVELAELAELVLDWGILTFSEIILNFSNYDKLCNNSRKCLSQFCNKLVLEIHSLHN